MHEEHELTDQEIGDAVEDVLYGTSDAKRAEEAIRRRFTPPPSFVSVREKGGNQFEVTVQPNPDAHHHTYIFTHR